MTIPLNRLNFGDLTSKTGIVLVDCWASWCSNCAEFGELFLRASIRHPQHTFATLDTQVEKELRTQLGIHHLPALLVFRDGFLLFQQPGNYDDSALDDVIQQAERLDMNLVRAELDATSGSPAAMSGI